MTLLAALAGNATGEPLLATDAGHHPSGISTSSAGSAVSGLAAGRSLYSGVVAIETAHRTGPGVPAYWELRDEVRGGHFAVDWSYPDRAMRDDDNAWGDHTAGNSQTAAVDAQYGNSVAWDYFKNVHGRLGMFNDGLAACTKVHWRSNYVGTMWQPADRCIYLGDGDGVIARPLVSLDIIGHEWTHGLTAATARLGDLGENGGLSEATSDIFGTAAEFYAGNPNDPGDYLIAEEAYLSGFLRRMDNPAADGLSPNCWSPSVGQLAKHLAAGPANHFFYLLAEGSGLRTINGVQHNSTTCNGSSISGIGRATAERIWYRALTSRFNQNTNYTSARNDTIIVARSLYGIGSAQCITVERAWSAVLVAPAGEACGNPPLPAGNVVPNQYMNSLFSDYGNNAGCADWSGADGTQSVLLPSGHRAWFFSDTYLGSPAERPGGFLRGFIRNSIILQQGGNLRTITGGNTCREGDGSIGLGSRYARTPIEIAGEPAWHWGHDAMVVGPNVVKFASRNVVDGQFWTETHTAIATIPISSLENSSTLQVAPVLMPQGFTPGGRPIMWGAALLEYGGYVYIYGWGAMDSSNTKRLFLARTTKPNLATYGQWQYNTGAGDQWSAPGVQSAARPIMASVPVEAGFSVIRANNQFWFIQHEPNLNGGDIVAHPATSPWGFGSSRVRLYTPPETPRDAAHKYQFVYEARVQPGLSRGSNKIIMAYNVNTSAVSIGCRSRTDHDASIYRPRFIDVPLSMLNASAAFVPDTKADAQPEAGVQRGPHGLSPAPTLPGTPSLHRSTHRQPAPKLAPMSEPDLNWYDQWSAPVQANGGCPVLDKPTQLRVGAQPDGRVDLNWDDYGRDMWYWIYRRDVTAGTGFQRFELWAPTNWAADYPVRQSSDNGHQYSWYVVPFANGRSSLQGPASNAPAIQVWVQRPAAPPSAQKLWYAQDGLWRISWESVSYPSDAVFYWIDSSDIFGLQCDTFGPYSFETNWVYLGRHHSPGGTLCERFHVYAENLGGTGAATEATYPLVNGVR